MDQIELLESLDDTAVLRVGSSISESIWFKAIISVAASKRKPMPKEIESLILSMLVFLGNTSAK